MVDYSLIYRISAKVEDAKKGFGRIQDAFGRMTESGKIMSRRMGNLLTLQKLAWIGFAYVVAKSIFDVLRKSSLMQTFLTAWGTIIGAILDTILAPWSDELTTLTEKFAGLQEKINELPDPKKKFLGGVFGASALVVGLGAVGTIVKTVVWPGLVAIGAGAKTAGEAAVIAGSKILGLGGAAAVGVGAAVGAAVGLGAVWVLQKTGVLKSIKEMGDGFRKSHPTIMAFADVLGAPLATIGAIATGIATGDFQDIPYNVKKVWERAGAVTAEFAESFKRGVSIAFNGAINIATDICDRFKDIGKKIIDKIISGLGNLKTRLITAIKNKIPNLHDIFHITPQVIAVGAHYADLINRGIASTKIEAPKFNLHPMEEFGETLRAPAGRLGGAVSSDNRQYNMPITIDLGITMKEEGKSAEEIATEVANLLSLRLRRVI